MNVLLADDESLVRSSLRSMLHDLSIPVQVIGEARNGEEMVELVRQRQPDLVFVDIRMPRLNGLDAIRRGKAVSPYTQWVILSGYSEFAYAKEALELGTHGYLLKPASPEELAQCMSAAVAEHKKTLAALNLEFEHMLVSLLHGTGPRDEMNLGPFFSHCEYHCVMFVMDSSRNDTDGCRRQAFDSDLQQMMNDLPQGPKSRAALLTLREGHLALIWARDVSAGSERDQLCADGKQVITSAYEQCVEQCIQRHSTTGFAIYALQTAGGSSCGIMQQQMAELQSLASLRMLLPDGQVYKLTDLQSHAIRPDVRQLAIRLDQLCRHYAAKDYVNYHKELTQIEQCLTTLHLWHGSLALDHVCRFMNRAIGAGLSPEHASAHWIRLLQQRGENILADTPSENNWQGDLVQRVMAYVDRHYMNDIGIGQIAGEMNVTPNYLSSLFHKKGGITFVKYLTKTRMLKAKELLLTRPNLKIQTVAEQVGYHSTRHFTKLFSEYYGCYPSELREKHRA
ncbi:response regulator [Paenibacillus xerothermodurans]|uniref:Response regulator n=1 Tax=Paenibacillus xerothermodurans TaxID=1977292 RepID=A0A2W1NNQ8_PAEXE|nr:response regulator [Paenibacillus xerothermodurans]PZE20563.1 response regulator [Paenibacillus xerothermodurans]